MYLFISYLASMYAHMPKNSAMFILAILCSCIEFPLVSARSEITLEEVEKFSDLCMEIWTQADLIRAITISPAGKEKVLDEILANLVTAYGMFYQMYENKKIADQSKCYNKEKIWQNSLKSNNVPETLGLLHQTIYETFSPSNHLLASLYLLESMIDTLRVESIGELQSNNRINQDS